jgi:hypothetical protein
MYRFSHHRPLFKSIGQPNELRVSESFSQEAEAELAYGVNT